MDYWAKIFEDIFIKAAQAVIAGIVVLCVTQKIQRDKERNKLRNVLMLIRNEISFHAHTFEQYKDASIIGQHAIIVGTEEWKTARNILIDLSQNHFKNISDHYIKLDAIFSKIFIDNTKITQQHAVLITTLYDSANLALSAIDKALYKLK